MKKPNPGTQEALNMGCTCPVIDNHYGKGYFGDGESYIYIEDCPIHNEEFKKYLPTQDTIEV